VVFTVPQPIAAIALQNKEVVYNILFRAAAETLRKGRSELRATFLGVRQFDSPIACRLCGCC
jgi:hypothetical protein